MRIILKILSSVGIMFVSGALLVHSLNSAKEEALMEYSREVVINKSKSPIPVLGSRSVTYVPDATNEGLFHEDLDPSPLFSSRKVSSRNHHSVEVMTGMDVFGSGKKLNQGISSGAGGSAGMGLYAMNNSKGMTESLNNAVFYNKYATKNLAEPYADDAGGSGGSVSPGDAGAGEDLRIIPMNEGFLPLFIFTVIYLFLVKMKRMKKFRLKEF